MELESDGCIIFAPLAEMHALGITPERIHLKLGSMAWNFLLFYIKVPVKLFKPVRTSCPIRTSRFDEAC
jgi:hypothetical protein